MDNNQLQKLHEAQRLLADVYGDFEHSNRVMTDLLSCADGCIWEAIGYLQKDSTQ